MKHYQPYHDLIVWKESHAFCLLIYRLTDTFPAHEKYGLVSQLRRAAVSIETNLVEGHAKRSTPDFLRYLNIADGSARECAVLIELSRDLGYLTQEDSNAAESQRRKTGYLLQRIQLGLRRSKP